MIVIVSDDPQEVITILRSLDAKPAPVKSTPEGEVISREDLVEAIRREAPIAYSGLLALYPNQGGRIRALLATMKGTVVQGKDLLWTVPT